MHAFFFSGEKASHSSGRTAPLACSMALSYKSSSSLSTSGGAGDFDCWANSTLSGGGWSGEPGWNFGGSPSQPGGGAVGEAGGCCLGGELAGLGGAALPTVSFIRRQGGRGQYVKYVENGVSREVLSTQGAHESVCPGVDLKLIGNYVLL